MRPTMTKLHSAACSLPLCQSSHGKSIASGLRVCQIASSRKVKMLRIAILCFCCICRIICVSFAYRLRTEPAILDSCTLDVHAFFSVHDCLSPLSHVATPQFWRFFGGESWPEDTILTIHTIPTATVLHSLLVL